MTGVAPSSSYSLWGIAATALQWDYKRNYEWKAMEASLAAMATQQALVATEEDLATEALAEASALEGEALALKEKAAKDFAASEMHLQQAAADEAEAEELSASAARDEGAAEVQQLEVDAQELINEEQTATAAEESARAIQLQLTWDTEESTDAAAVGLCQFLPLLDIVCDVVGAATQVGMAGTAAASAELAAEALEASRLAMAAQAAADAQEAIVLDLQSRASEEEAAATVLQEQTSQLRIQAEEEEASAEESEIQSNQALKQEAANEQTAVEEQAVATEAESKASSSLLQSVQHASKAGWYAIISTLWAIPAFFHFALRTMGGVVLPGVMHAHSSMQQPDLRNLYVWKSTYFVAHGLLLASSLGHSGLFSQLGGHNTSLRSRGEAVLHFALEMGWLQATLLHILPHMVILPLQAFLVVQTQSLSWSKSWRWWHDGLILLLHWFQKFFIFVGIIVLEVLIIWTVSGHGFHANSTDKSSEELLHGSHSEVQDSLGMNLDQLDSQNVIHSLWTSASAVPWWIYTGGLALVTIVTYYGGLLLGYHDEFLETRRYLQEETSAATTEQHHSEMDLPTTEETQLLKHWNTQDFPASGSGCSMTVLWMRHFFSLFYSNAVQLPLLLEVLFVALMSALVMGCMSPALRPLWQRAHLLQLLHDSHGWAGLVVSSLIALIFMIFIGYWFRLPNLKKCLAQKK